MLKPGDVVAFEWHGGTAIGVIVSNKLKIYNYVPQPGLVGLNWIVPPKDDADLYQYRHAPLHNDCDYYVYERYLEKIGTITSK
jgi:hypothetical protein